MSNSGLFNVQGPLNYLLALVLMLMSLNAPRIFDWLLKISRVSEMRSSTIVT